MLERKRDDIVRAAVLQIHTAIEDLLTLHLACVLLQTNSTEERETLHCLCERGRSIQNFDAATLAMFEEATSSALRRDCCG